MKRWIQNLSARMQTWMYGRYGYDELSRFLSVAAVVLILFSMVFPPVNAVALALLVWGMFRTYSRNIEKRQREREAYLGFTGKIKQSFKRWKNMWRERKTHRYYKCPSCKVHLRVPKGRGQIEISCPKCHNKIIRKT